MAATTKRLRSGFTTGTAAAAAVKGALYLLVRGEKKKHVTVPFLSQGSVSIDIHSLRQDRDRAICTVIKDGGDDPDITNRAEIGAGVSCRPSRESRIIIRGGNGIGRVTKPGLEIPPGEPAINPGPRTMIFQSVRDVITAFDTCPQTVDIEIFAPRGEILAQKTLNHRLGIVGGISILGTTGIVRPMSHDAYVATIRASLRLAGAAGIKTVFFTTGRRSERFAQEIFSSHPKEAFIQVGDFFGKSLESASGMSFDRIVVVVFFGKAIKMAQGFYHTHAAKSNLILDQLACWAHELTSDPDLKHTLQSTNTAREALSILQKDHTSVIETVCDKIVQAAVIHAPPPMEVQSMILDFSGQIAAQSDTALKDIRP